MQLGAIVKEEFEDSSIAADLNINDLGCLWILVTSRLCVTAIELLGKILHLTDDNLFFCDKGFDHFLFRIDYLDCNHGSFF